MVFDRLLSATIDPDRHAVSSWSAPDSFASLWTGMSAEFPLALVVLLASICDVLDPAVRVTSSL